MENEVNEVTNDKWKIIILTCLIIFIVLLIIFFSIFGIINFLDEQKKGPESVSTTTRRTYKTTSASTTNYADFNIETEEETTEATTEATTTTVATTVPTTKKTTVKKTTTTAAVEEEEEIIIEEITEIVTSPSSSRELVEGPTKFPNAVDSMEWEIVNYINNARATNNLPPLGVAEDLRNLAETSAEIMAQYGENAAYEYIAGHNNYRYWTNLRTNTYEMYNKANAATSIAVEKYARYMGVGVIYRSNGVSGIPTYYFVLVYE